MAKKRKLPKKPKASASLETWNNWHRRAAEVKKHNSQLESDKKKKQALIQKARTVKA
jgi:hypothetical protein